MSADVGTSPAAGGASPEPGTSIESRGVDTVSPGHCDVAIIGLSCLFPQAPDVQTFWQNILSKVDAVTTPGEAWGAERYLGGGTGGADPRIYTAAGGFLGDLYRFDPREFGIMPNSLDGQEPDQFLALKLARDALADAGYLGDGVDHTETGVILGHSTYLHRGQANMVQHGMILDQTLELLRELDPSLGEEQIAQARKLLESKLPPINADIGPGLVPNVMTGRIANRLDLKGPNYLIDAACASSLLAVQAAINELDSRRSRLMLAGGVNASTAAEVYMVFCQLGALSRRGHARPFDVAADGTLLGEGLGVVALKRLDDAIADGDRIYAVLKGVGQSSDGRGLGLLAPRLEGEVLAIERAYRQSGVDPDSISLLEAHGTGIALGDQTEIAALSQVMSGRGDGLPRCAVGSVKSMICHCIPAAGVAGLIKTTLALHNKILPPTLCDEVNPELGLETSAFYINTEARPWIHSPTRPRRAAVNAFGFGGINTHAVLEEWTGAESPAVTMDHWPSELMAIAAPDRPSLIEQVDRLIRFVDGAPDPIRLRDLARTLAENRDEGPCRLAIVATSTEEFRKKLARARDALGDEMRQSFQMRSGVYFRDRPLEGKLAFLFPGEGSQYRQMLQELALAFDGVRRWFDFWDSLYDGDHESLPSPVVFPPPTTLDEATDAHLDERLHDVTVGSESVFITCQAILELLGKHGIEPDAMVGHSSGENTAVTASGLLRLDGQEELRAYIHRLRRMYREMETVGGVVTGAMLTVGAVRRNDLLKEVEDSSNALQIALDNCFHQAVLFGSPEAIEAAASKFRRRGGLCSYLSIDRAYHTPAFEPVAAAIERLNQELPFSAPKVPVYSCATAAPFPEDVGEIRRLVAGQWAAPVRFTETVQRMYEDGVRLFVEVGPASNLTGFVGDILRGADHLAVATNHRNKPSLAQFHTTLGQLFVHGYPVELGHQFDGRDAVSLNLDADADAAQPPRRAPLLANTLPYVRLEPGEAERLRTLMGEAGVVSGTPGELASPPVTVPDMESPVAYAPPAPPAVTPAGEQLETEVDDGVLTQHFDLMREFLSNQRRVMTASLLGADAQCERSLLSRVLARGGDGRVVAEIDLDVSTQAYLRDHVLYASQISDLDPDLHGLSVVPFAVSVEMLAQAASLLSSAPAVVALENVRAYGWIALETGRKTIRAEAERRPASGDQQRIHAAIYDGEALLADGEVVFAHQHLPGESALPALRAPQASPLQSDQMYTTGMFHGPIFQSIGQISAWGEEGMDAWLNDCSPEGFLAPGHAPEFLLNPIVLDAVGQLTAFWLFHSIGNDFSSFPAQIERIELMTSVEGSVPGARLRGRFTMSGNAVSEPGLLEGQFEAVDADGQALFRVSGWRDRFHPVPQRFFHGRTYPREGFYGEALDVSIAGLPADTVIWCVRSFDADFMAQAGGIFLHLLAHTVLGRDERLHWLALTGTPRQKWDWLLELIAIKEAARTWIVDSSGYLLYPADSVVEFDAESAPYVVGDGLEPVGALPAVSVARSGGYWVAVASPPDWPVGIDISLPGSGSQETLPRETLSDEERRVLAQAEANQSTHIEQHILCIRRSGARLLGPGPGRKSPVCHMAGMYPDGRFVVRDQWGREAGGQLINHGALIVALSHAVGLASAQPGAERS